ncbi:autotransporter outer membrane beta-barrel domain-containing protein [Marinomonas agarivorans]|nr:autotransporter outer membrane beta-barrel domain-containing protein [Marinomonas agarivorans]
MPLNISMKYAAICVIGYITTFFTSAQAASFSYTGGTSINTVQTLNSGEVGSIDHDVTITTQDAGNGSIILIENAHLTNSGTISTTSNTTNNSVGVYASNDASPANSDNNSINNLGSIFTLSNGAGQSIGIHVRNGENSTASNSGKITTTRSTTAGDNIGIYLQISHGAKVENSGFISSTSENAVSYGILTAGSNNAVTNNTGSISISSSSPSNGIRITNGASNTITNSGSLTLTTSTSTTSHTGIRVDSSSSANITNSGSISLSGATTHTGIKLEDADNATVNNSGTISAPQAVLFDSNSSNTTLNILSGSKIFGTIQLQGSNDTVNVKSNIYSSDLYIEGAEEVNISGTAIKIDEGSGNTRVVTIGANNETSRGIAMADLVSSVHSVINKRATRPNQLKPITLASLTLIPALFQERPPVLWSQFFGGTRKNTSDTNGYEQTHYGVAIGYERDYESTRFGLVGGLSNANIDTASSTGKTASYYSGLYAHYHFDDYRLTTSVLGGINKHDNKRSVISSSMGTETAKSDFYSVFVSPSITISATLKHDRWTNFALHPSAGINYSASNLTSYTESGTSDTNLHFDGRFIHSLTAHASLMAAYQMTPTMELNIKSGINYLAANQGSTTVSLNGTTLSLENTDENNGMGHFIGLGIHTALEHNIELNGEVETGWVDKDTSYTSLSATLSYVF